MPEATSTPRNRRIAMLIDGDNAQPALIDKMLMEASKYGTVLVRRIYGDWTTPASNGWKEVLPGHAIQPIQQFQNTTGKNATDSALIIDAMDLLHQGVVDCFCLVSSDSDFTRLATRIRESGSFVIGIGKKTTPRSFVVACDVFTYTELLGAESTPDKPVKASAVVASPVHKPAIEIEVAVPNGKKPITAPQTAPPNGKKPAPTPVAVKPAAVQAAAPNGKQPAKAPATTKPAAKKAAKTEPEPLPLLRKAFDISVQENGWTMLTALGQALKKIDPSFDSRTYGHPQLTKLLRAYPHLFEIDDTVTNVRMNKSASK